MANSPRAVKVPVVAYVLHKEEQAMISISKREIQDVATPSILFETYLITV